MLFSIIVPIYKVEEFLRQCIESVLNQTYRNFELILVDDGSPDNCGKICDQYAEKDARILVVHKENGGLVSARQAGAKKAQGDYIICLDGDDWLPVDSLETMQEIISKYKVDIVIGASYWSYDKKEVLHKAFTKTGLYNKEDIKAVIYPCLIEDKRGNYFSPNIWAKAIRKEIYIEEQLAVGERIKIGEDQAVVKPCVYKANSLYITDQPLYYYRQNAMSMTKNKSVFDLNGAQLIAKHFENRIDMKEFDFQAQVNRHFVHDLFNAAVSQFNDRKIGLNNIKQRIKMYLKKEEIKRRVYNCKFSIKNVKGNIALFALKTRNIPLMKFYYNVKSELI